MPAKHTPESKRMTAQMVDCTNAACTRMEADAMAARTANTRMWSDLPQQARRGRGAQKITHVVTRHDDAGYGSGESFEGGA